MKHLLSVSLLAIATILPIATFAQPVNGPFTGTGAQVQAAKAGQNRSLHQSEAGYPGSQQNATSQQSGDATGYGSQAGGSSESRTSSAHASLSGANARLFSHH